MARIVYRVPYRRGSKLSRIFFAKKSYLAFFSNLSFVCPGRMQARQRCVTDLFTSEMHKFLMWDALLGGQLARGTGAEKYFPFLDAFLDLGPWCGVAVTLLVQIRHATADFIAVQSLPGFIAMECNMSCGVQWRYIRQCSCTELHRIKIFSHNCTVWTIGKVDEVKDIGKVEGNE